MPEDLISTDQNSSSIYIHSGITSTVTTSFSSPGTLAGEPMGTTLDGGIPTRRYGNLVSSDEADNSVYIHVGITSTVATSFSLLPSPSTGPPGITLDASGNLISSRSGAASVYIHSGITITITTSFSLPGPNARGIALDASGNLISSDVTNQSIYIHSGVTSTITTSFSSSFRDGLEVTEDGNLISTNYANDRIYVHSGITSATLTWFDAPKTFPWGVTLFGPTPAAYPLIGKPLVAPVMVGRPKIR